ncbi:hypothetical protein [Zarconia navalis]|nr:hypothetical protein [Zarconia navalis]
MYSQGTISFLRAWAIDVWIGNERERSFISPLDLHPHIDPIVV